MHTLKLTGEFFLLMMLITLIHELGHIFFMRVFNVRLRRVQIFYFTFFEVDFNTFRIAIGLLPVGGYTLPQASDISFCSTYKKALIYSGGIFFNLIAAGIAYCFDGVFAYDFMIFNLVKAALNSLPVSGSDGYKLVMLNRLIK